MNNYREGKQFESSMKKAKRIPDSDCNPHDKMSHSFWVSIQSKPNKKYLVTFHRTNFLTCDCPWSIRGNI